MLTKILLVVLLSVAVRANSEPQRAVALFDGVDKDHDGALTRQELDQIFLIFDLNSDKQVTKDEFVKDWTTTLQLGNSREAEALFLRADADDDNEITQKDLPIIFAYFDMDDNGKVDLNEFLTQWGDLTLMPVDPVTGHVDTVTLNVNNGKGGGN